MCFNPSPVRRVPSPNRYMAVARFCFCKNNKRTIDRGHLSIALIWFTIGADLVGSGALEDAVRVVRVAEPTLSVP